MKIVLKTVGYSAIGLFILLFFIIAAPVAVPLFVMEFMKPKNKYSCVEVIGGALISLALVLPVWLWAIKHI